MTRWKNDYVDEWRKVEEMGEVTCRHGSGYRVQPSSEAGGSSKRPS